MGEVIAPIVERVIKDGLIYLVKKFTDAAGRKVRQWFRDEDDNGVPDTEEPEFTDYEDEYVESDVSESFGSESESEPITSEPVVSEPSVSYPIVDTSTPVSGYNTDIVVVTPNGVITMYEESFSDEYSALVSQATDYWLSTYGATVKDFQTYTVSESLLFIIACCSLFALFCKLFKRRKL